jgi:hypothetical protein
LARLLVLHGDLELIFNLFRQHLEVDSIPSTLSRSSHHDHTPAAEALEPISDTLFG